MGRESEGLVVESLSKRYDTPSEPLVVLRDLDLTLERGAAMAVMGPSGSGKSTLLYTLGTLERPTSGAIRLDGEDVLALDGDALAAFRNRRIGFVFQDHHLLPQCTALENTLVPALAGGSGRADAPRRAAELLDRVGLAARADHLPSELSGGEKQRVAIARALLNDPLLLLADEPTGNLDRKRAAEAADLLLELQRERNSILLLVTHSEELAARFPRRAQLIDGKLEDS